MSTRGSSATNTVSDEDIAKILEADEAGVGTIMSVYEPLEASYFAALGATPPTVAYSTSSTAR